MQNMLGMLFNLFQMLDQTTDEEVKKAVALFRDLFQKLTGKDSETWLGELRKFLRKEPCWVTSIAQSVVSVIVCYIVDCTLSLEEMIRVCNLDSVNKEITTVSFPITTIGRDEWEFKVFHFNRHISSEDAIAGITSDDAKNPWQPALIEHLLTYGAKNPEEQRKYPIIGLGSVAEVGGDRGVPYLDVDGSKRGLGLDWFGRWLGCPLSFPCCSQEVSGFGYLIHLAIVCTLPLGNLDPWSQPPVTRHCVAGGFFFA